MSTHFVKCPDQVHMSLLELWGHMLFDEESKEQIYRHLYGIIPIPEDKGHWVILDNVPFDVYAEFAKEEDAVWFKMKYC